MSTWHMRRHGIPRTTSSMRFIARLHLSLDAGWHEDWLADPRALGILRKVDVFFPNEAEGARMTGETEPARILQRFADAGVPAWR